ncbi:MAG: glycosyltransferase [Candidatus Pacebacteria bacterium]|nr:glycosyltransferase [Candidatus Paceibacterota bacterium]
MLIEICLPAYNEETILKKNITILLNFLKNKTWSFNWQITVAINNSSDNSLEIIKKLVQNNKEISYYNLEKGGKGHAIKYAWHKSKADIFVYMDVDLAVSLENLPSLLEAIYKEKNHLAWGSRLLAKSQTERGWLRTISSKIYNLFSQLALKHKFSDLQCGFKAIDNKIREKILPLVKDDAWFFDTELIIFSKDNGYRLKEIPVNWKESRYQERKSKIKPFKDACLFVEKTLKLRKRIKTLH